MRIPRVEQDCGGLVHVRWANAALAEDEAGIGMVAQVLGALDLRGRGENQLPVPAPVIGPV